MSGEVAAHVHTYIHTYTITYIQQIDPFHIWDFNVTVTVWVPQGLPDRLLLARKVQAFEKPTEFAKHFFRSIPIICVWVGLSARMRLLAKLQTPKR